MFEYATCRTYTLAAAQINPQLGDLTQNLSIHSEMIEEARGAGVEALVFPELSLTGYDLGSKVAKVALPAEHRLLRELAELTGSMLTLVGFVEEVGRGEYTNSVACLYNGEVIAVHRKINLCTYGGHEEGKIFQAGNSLTQFRVNGLTYSVLICADLWNPGLAHAAMMGRPDVVLAPINSAVGMVEGGFDDQANWGTCLQFYSMVYGTPIVMAHRYGSEGDSHFWGGSRIVDSNGHTLAQTDAELGLVKARIDTSDIASSRFAMPTHRDANTPLVTQLLKQLG